jgi:Permuted papain-like amidase enzyme, YaeF/YiiX, C92 family
MLNAAIADFSSRHHPVRTTVTDATTISLSDLTHMVSVGDLIFIRVPFAPFRKIAAATGSWTNHVGVVVDIGAGAPVIAESKFPLSRMSSLHNFVGRSQHGRVAVSRLHTVLTEEQRRRVLCAARRRLGVLYDTGFNMRSRRQFCSRFAREVIAEATGILIGEVESFGTLLSRRPDTGLGFWTAWYFGRIPWSRETISPASLLASANLEAVFDGTASLAAS